MNTEISFRGIEWSHLILKCSQNLAFARIARKNYMGARLLACSCSQKFCNCLSNTRARKNKHFARMLADARKDHSIPLVLFPTLRFFSGKKRKELSALP